MPLLIANFQITINTVLQEQLFAMFYKIVSVLRGASKFHWKILVPGIM